MTKFQVSYHWWGWIIVLLVLWIKSLNFPIHDFANYYFAGDLLKEGALDSRIYFPEFFNLWIKDSGVSGQFVSYAPNTPFMPLVLVPFTWVSVINAKWIFSLSGGVFFLLSLNRFTHYFEINKWLIAISPLFFLVPLHHNILFGQMYLWVLILLLEGLMAYDKEQWIAMALCWGLAVVLKVFPIVVIGFLWGQKSYKAIMYLVISIVSFIAISILITGWDLWAFYWNEILPRFHQGEIAGVIVDNYQSASMFLKRLFWYDIYHNPDVLIQDKALFATLLWVFKLVWVSITIWLSTKVSNLVFRFSIWLLLSVIISSYGSTYGLLILMFLFFAIGPLDIDYRSKIGILILMFLGLNNPMISDWNFPWNYFRLFAWFGIIGILLWSYRSLKFVKWVAIGSVCIGVFHYLWNDREKQKTVENLNTPILTYDYQITDHGVQYVYWSNMGAQVGEIWMNVDDWSTEEVEIQSNQVYYKRTPITNDRGFKKKALRVNQSILFLSDQGRGIGFYGLQKIDLNGEE